MEENPKDQYEIVSLEGPEEKQPEHENDDEPYPKGMHFIIMNEFFERGAFYGIKNLLTIFLKSHLGYDVYTSMDIYHGFSMTTMFVPIFSAIISDSYSGKYPTIVMTSVIYLIGIVILTYSPIQPSKAMAMSGMFLMALGSGGVKPIIAAFGGDLFRADQEKQIQKFFSLFYLSVNVGGLIFSSLTPILRRDFYCFQAYTCYPLAFGVSLINITLSLIIFLAGTRFYKRNPPSGNILVNVVSCIHSAITSKFKAPPSDERNHWLEYADQKYSPQLINDIKGLLNVLTLYIPLPFYWALYDQQGSSWTLQAKNMDGQVTSTWWIPPDVVQVINPLLVIIFIPMSQYFVYPFFKKCNFLVKPLHRMVAGGFLTAISFVIAAMIQMSITANLSPEPEEGMTKLTLINGFNCQFEFKIDNDTYNIAPLSNTMWVNVTRGSEPELYLKGSNCFNIPSIQNSFYLNASKHILAFITLKENRIIIEYFDDNPYKPDSNNEVMLLKASTIEDIRIDGPISLPTDAIGKYVEAVPGTYTVTVNNTSVDVHLGIGGRYVIVIFPNSLTSFFVKTHVAVAPNKVHITWLLFQFIVITLGEVLFSVTGLEFAYTEASPRMKSILQGFWLLNVGFGNLIVIVINQIYMKSHVVRLLVYAGLMALDIFFFMFLVFRYKQVPIDQSPILSEVPEKIK